jgi:hypothetical protein
MLIVDAASTLNGLFVAPPDCRLSIYVVACISHRVTELGGFGRCLGRSCGTRPAGPVGPRTAPGPRDRCRRTRRYIVYICMWVYVRLSGNKGENRIRRSGLSRSPLVASRGCGCLSRTDSRRLTATRSRVSSAVSLSAATYGSRFGSRYDASTFVSPLA